MYVYGKIVASDVLFITLALDAGFVSRKFADVPRTVWAAFVLNPEQCTTDVRLAITSLHNI